MTTHAKLSPSASDRWLHCAASVRLNVPDESSNVYADEGTAAHALFEMCQRLDQDPDAFIGTAMYKEHVVNDDMAAAVGHALDYVRSYTKRFPKTKVLIEREVDPYRLLGCDKGHASGTPDTALDNPVQLELTVIDYKHGAGVPVEVGGNTQILQYLVAYMAQFLSKPYKVYRAVIIQPRSRHDEGPVRVHEYTHAEVMAHAGKLKKRVVFIAKNPDQREAGAWCRWCKAAARCPTLRGKVQELAQLEFKDAPVRAKDKSPMLPIEADELSNKQLATIMSFTDVIEAWLKEVRGLALTTLQRGQKIPGWKLVFGKSTRSWKDEAKARALLVAQGLKPDEVAPRSVVSVAQAEKLLKARTTGKKKDFELPRVLAGQVARSTPALHVAKEDDPRKPVVRGQEFVGK